MPMTRLFSSDDYDAIFESHPQIEELLDKEKHQFRTKQHNENDILREQIRRLENELEAQRRIARGIFIGTVNGLLKEIRQLIEERDQYRKSSDEIIRPTNNADAQLDVFRVEIRNIYKNLHWWTPANQEKIVGNFKEKLEQFFKDIEDGIP